MHTSKRIYWLPILMIIAFLMDGVMMNHFSVFLIESGYTLVPRIVVITLVLLTFIIDHSSMFWFAVMVGVMYDSYYSGILGVYMAIFAVIVRVIGHIRGKISINPFTLGLALIFLLTITETGVYIIYTLIGIQHLTVQQFLVQRLGSSLILNIVLYYLLYIPLKNFALWVQSGISHEKISLRAARRNQGNSYHYR